jgi:hypothetical protein
MAVTARGPREWARCLTVIAVVLMVGAAGFAEAADDGGAVSVRVMDHVSHEPATIRLVITLIPDDANRVLSVELESLSLFRSSLVPLDGAAAPSVHWLRFERLPAGEYVVTVRLVRAESSEAVARTMFVVVE